MHKRLGKDRKYYLADMHHGKDRLNSSTTDSLDSYMASIDYGRVLAERKDSSVNRKRQTSRISKQYKPVVALDGAFAAQKKYVKWAIDKYSLRESSIPINVFEEFTVLVRDSEDYLQFYGKKLEEDLNSLVRSIKGKKCVLLCILKNRYSFFKRNGTELVNRVLLSLGANPLNDFSPIDWNRFVLLRRMMTQKDIDLLACANFFQSMFMHGASESLSKRQFQQVLKVLCSRIDNQLEKAHQATVSSRIMEAAHNQDLFDSTGVISKSLLRQVFMKQILFDIIDLIVIIFRQF